MSAAPANDDREPSRAVLARAHATMTPEEIAENALRMADLIDVMVDQDQSRQRQMIDLGDKVGGLGRIAIAQSATFKNADALLKGHRKAAARKMIADAAAIPYPALPDPIVPPETLLERPVLFGPRGLI